MIIAEALSEQEINKHITWLENEIDRCLEYDLPTQRFESELNALDEVLYYQTLRTHDSC